MNRSLAAAAAHPAVMRLRRPSVAVPSVLLAAVIAVAATVTGNVFAVDDSAATQLAKPVSEKATGYLPVKWQQTHWSEAFTTTGYSGNHQPAVDFAGHPLDVTFDETGAAWMIGEFGFQVIRTQGADMTRIDLPLKSYTDATGKITGLTQPFTSSFGTKFSSTSELNEAALATPGAVWFAFGGQMSASASPKYNHSILLRVSTNAPYETCAVPLPGGNNEVVGLAYDNRRDRVYYAESTGDHFIKGRHYSNIGWVQNDGLGAKCQNDLDYGGDPALSAARNTKVRNAASTTINQLACTPKQEKQARKGKTPACVHLLTRSIASGATHLAYDSATDTLWSTNWFTNTLTRTSPRDGRSNTYKLPASAIAFPGVWQIDLDVNAVYMNEYKGNRILRFDKRKRTWSVITSPAVLLSKLGLETHSIAVEGTTLWFTISDEDFNPGVTALGSIDLEAWRKGKGVGTLYTGWNDLTMQRSAPEDTSRSFRGIDLDGAGRIVLADHGDMQTLVLTPR